jgi:hypothetical protein
MEANIEIYGNRMDYVRDNCIEPERVTFNLHVYHNEFNQTGSRHFLPAAQHHQLRRPGHAAERPYVCVWECRVLGSQ